MAGDDEGELAVEGRACPGQVGQRLTSSMDGGWQAWASEALVLPSVILYPTRDICAEEEAEPEPKKEEKKEEKKVKKANADIEGAALLGGDEEPAPTAGALH